MKTKTLISNQVIEGKNVRLIPIGEADIYSLAECLVSDKNCYLGKFSLKDWTEEKAVDYVLGMINEGDIYIWSYVSKVEHPKRFGFIFLTDVCDFAAEIAGLMDMRMARENQRINGRTYPEDAQITLIQHCFDCGLERVSTEVIEENRLAILLQERIGFVKEGITRKSFKVDGVLKNMVHFAILKEEFENG